MCTEMSQGGMKRSTFVRQFLDADNWSERRVVPSRWQSHKLVQRFHTYAAEFIARDIPAGSADCSDWFIDLLLYVNCILNQARLEGSFIPSSEH